MQPIRQFLPILFLLFTNASFATPSRAEIEALLRSFQGTSRTEKIAKMSAIFLNSPYQLGNLGEGPTGLYDQDPLYRFDVFDCITLVETSLALGFSENFSEFEINMNRIRYQASKISFPTRNHFTELDWNAANIQEGFVKDITESLIAPKKPEIAATIIDKPAWYRKMNLSSLRLDGLSQIEMQKRLEELHTEGDPFQPSFVTTPYLSIDFLLSNDGMAVLAAFPQVSIINIVRPNWDLTQSAGTHLNISHQGLGIRKNGVLYFRNASTISHTVIDIPLVDYLRRYQTSATVKGIQILKVLD